MKSERQVFAMQWAGLGNAIHNLYNHRSINLVDNEFAGRYLENLQKGLCNSI